MSAAVTGGLTRPVVPRRDIRADTLGRWPGILAALGLSESALSGRDVPCPMCGGDDRFRYMRRDDGHVVCRSCMPPEDGVDGIGFVMRWLDVDFVTAVRRVREVSGGAALTPVVDDSAKRAARARAIWAESAPLAKGDATHRYLHGRGLAGVPFGELMHLRTHPALGCWDATGSAPTLLGRFPAMVALVADGAVHVTYLAADGAGKADVPRQKRRMGSAPRGSGVRLLAGDETQPVVIAEGIETTLALWKLGGKPAGAVAALDAGGLERIETDAPRVVVGSDHDPSFVGQAAAYSAGSRLARDGREVRVVVPPEPGDWLDVLVARQEASR